MRKQIVAWMLTALILAGLLGTVPVSAEENTRQVDILWVRPMEDGIDVVFFYSGHDGWITYLCRRLDEENTPLLAAGQVSAVEGVGSLRIALDWQTMHGQCEIQVGGTQVNRPAMCILDFSVGQAEGMLTVPPGMDGFYIAARMARPYTYVFRLGDSEREDGDALVTGGTAELWQDQTMQMRFAVAVLGDVQPDGEVTATDALQTLKQAVGLVDLTSPAIRRAADVNNDGRIASTDALMILKYSVGLLLTL